jgi:2-keto-4-pentenoate hydratase/2-oxohepta-3-ene-1,7-dioic acid hydratase in catechol pathway
MTQSGSSTQLAVADGDVARSVGYAGDLSSLIADGVPLDGLTVGESLTSDWQAPIRPGKIVAIGLNYADHIREAQMEAPTRPLVFAKFPSSLVGPADSIRLPAEAERVDWEVELAVVIGRTMRHVPLESTLDYVFGYTVANDVSARDVQFGDGQWVRGKSFDTFCPIGPYVVTADEIPDPQALGLRTRVNGELVQNSSTAEMLFSVAELLAFCSANFTLDPGDVLLTGTPWGCGEFMSPRRSLGDGDVVEAEVDGIGTLVNAVVLDEPMRT